MSRVQLSKTQREKAKANRKSGIDHVFAMTVQFLHDMAAHLGDCNDVDIGFAQEQENPVIFLKPNQKTNLQDFEDFWESLCAYKPDDKNIVKLNSEEKSIKFESIDKLAYFFLSYAESFRQGMIAGHVIPNEKPIDTFRDPTVLNLHRDFYCSQQDVANTIKKMGLEIRKNPFLHFIYTSYDLNRAIKAVNNDFAGKKSSTYGEVLRFH